MVKYSEAQKRANLNYAKNHLKRIPLDVRKEKYEEIKDFALSHGESVNGFIKRAIDEAMYRDSDDTNSDRSK